MKSDTNSRKSVRTELNYRTFRGLVSVRKTHISGIRSVVSVGRKITEEFFPFHICNYLEASSCPHFLSYIQGKSCYNKIQPPNQISSVTSTVTVLHLHLSMDEFVYLLYAAITIPTPIPPDNHQIPQEQCWGISDTREF